MEVTKYYCELCNEEIKNKQWTQILIATVEYIPHRQDVVTHSKKICNNCMKELGLIEDAYSTKEIETQIRKKSVFKRFIKTLTGR